MRTWQRQILNRSFTALSVSAVAGMAAALVVLLLPIFVRGGRAVVFRGTVEFRRMIHERFGRGDGERLEAELARARQAREPMYRLLDEFGSLLNPDRLSQEADRVYDAYREELSRAVATGAMDRQEERELRRVARDIRNRLDAAFASADRDEVLAILAGVLDDPNRAVLVETPAPASQAAGLFEMARTYAHAVQGQADLHGLRQEYGQAYGEVVAAVGELFGPRPGEPDPQLDEFRWGATRMDRAEILLDRLLYARVKQEDTAAGQLQRYHWMPRAEQFAGTPLADLFPMVERDLDRMLLPERTFYWRYFTDESVAGSLYGGVGPEVWGTLMLAGTAMAFAFPLGVIAAAYLVECTGEGRLVRVIRVCVNTLAGVPSIVFGLFGLAFFVLFLIPLFGGPSKACVLAGGLTLAVLILPIIIRASEEAIKSVPRSYKEASLALGAGGARTFVTVTFPAALPGILTGVILALSRAAGETAPILFTAAAASGTWTTSLLRETPALTYSAYVFATGDNLAAKAPHNQYGMIMTLILLVLIMNIGAIALRGRIARKLAGR
ncbi:MAG: phosphate ABC transporter permease PstA [Planctomycetes bacterium]|nr:phosphate ABC transporter permease PstA [Planctomycetota bacterium]